MVEVAATTDEPVQPLHVAVIMDGNGRWARARGLPRTLGHREGAKAVRRTIEAAGTLGVTHLTLFGFSSENWNRPAGEVGEIMNLIRFYLRREITDLKKNNVRFRVIGDRAMLSDDLVKLIQTAEAETANNTGLEVLLAISYGARAEITDAMRLIARDVAAGRLDPSAIDEHAISDRLLTADVPDPDLVIRTSGEKRISNFLLWQCAYAELLFLDVLWPDFDGSALADALKEYARRDRRFGRAVG